MVSPSTSRADFGTKQTIDLGARRLGILDHVVQQRGCDRRIVELELRQDRRDFEGMREIGITGRTLSGGHAPSSRRRTPC